MANIYCTATNTGKGFFTHQDLSDFSLTGYIGNIWVLSDKPKAAAWISRVGGTAKTKAEAQTIVDDIVEAGQATWDALPDEEKTFGPEPAVQLFRPVGITLP
tara:strand:- start:328 stop:633 length:306 start_codon:yes stop_codon:yes gene_type:complete